MSTFFSVAWTVLVCSAVYAVPISDSEGSQANEKSIKIVGGTPATPGEFPFLVSLQTRSEKKHICGGILTDMSHVVTAASCVPSKVPSQFQVVAGPYTMVEAVAGQQQLRRLSTITVHPKYQFLDSHDDIAVLELQTPLNETSGVQALPLSRTSQQQQEYTGTCVIAGWGAISKDSEPADKLYKGDVTVHSRTYCSNAYPGEYNATMQICANGQNQQGEVIEACFGDVGGGLLCSKNGNIFLAGISSWGHMCGQVGKPGVYMEVSKYRAWLDSVIQAQSGDDDAGAPVGTTTTVPSTTTTKKATASAAAADNNDIIAASPEDPEDNKTVQTGCRTSNTK